MTRLSDGAIRWHGVLTDASQRRRAIEALCAGSSQFAAVTDAMSAFVQDGDWRQASAGILRCALEQTESEYGFVGVVVAGPTLRVLAHQGIEWDATVGRAFYDAALETYQESGYLEFPNRKNLLSYDGIDYCCAFVRDITERKRAEEELTFAIEAAENASRAKSVFLANMSHEIRTPIMAMLGAAELMGTAPADETERVDRRNVILRNGRHLVSLIDNLLDAARMEAGKLDIHPVHCSLPEIVADVLAATAALNRSDRVDYRFCYETAIPASIRTDSTRLKQALINLINNALKFTETGHIRVSVRVDRQAPDPRLSISVEDTGPGIPDASLARIFETFAQLDPSTDEISRGVGLGLPLAKGIAEQLGGTLDVVSAIGKGSTFTLRVATGPLDAVEWIAANDTKVLPSRASDRSGTAAQQMLRGRVLLGEDFRDTRELVQHAWRSRARK